MTEDELVTEVARLRRKRRDDARTEAKSCAHGLSHDVWESVSAFANTAGGTILLGLDESERFAPAKGFEVDKVLNAFVEGIGDGAAHGAKMTNPPRYALDRLGFEGRKVLCIRVDELAVTSKPSFITAKGIVGGSYKRVDDKDIRLSPDEVYELRNMTVSARSDRVVVEEADEGDLVRGVVDGFVAAKRLRGSKALRGAETRTDQLRNLGVMTRDGGVRLASLLCFGNYPQGFFPKLTIDVAVFPGTRKAEPGLPRFVDRVVCEGHLSEMLDEGMAAITRNLRVMSYVDGLGRRDVPEIPPVVMREALANAVLHREYAPQFMGQAVTVEVYPDRVEVTNPGGLWGGKTVENISDGVSRCRNDLLMAFASELPGSGGDGAPAEGQGSGVAMMEREMGRLGLPLPAYEAGFDYVKVTFLRRGPHSYASPASSGEARGGAGGEVLALFGDNPNVWLGARDVAERLGLSLSAARARIKSLVDDGALMPTAPPTDRTRKYRLP